MREMPRQMCHFWCRSCSACQVASAGTPLIRRYLPSAARSGVKTRSVARDCLTKTSTTAQIFGHSVTFCASMRQQTTLGVTRCVLVRIYCVLPSHLPISLTLVHLQPIFHDIVLTPPFPSFALSAANEVLVVRM